MNVEIETAGLLAAGTAFGSSVLVWLGTRAKALASVEKAREEAEAAKAAAESAVEVARTSAAASIIGPLFDRIAMLETKGEVRDSELNVVRAAVAECQHDRAESQAREERCIARVEQLNGTVVELQGMIHREIGARDRDVTQRVQLAVKDAVREEARRSATPPGQWPLDHDVRDPASRTRVDDPSDDE